MLDKADRLFGMISAETQQTGNIVNGAVKYLKLD